MMQMTSTLFIWSNLVACGLLIAMAGPQLTRYGDVIAEKTGVSGSWVGLVLLATVTSLPELVTGISSVTIANVPNIAVGEILGSCVFNLIILVLLDFLVRGEPVYRRARQGHILSAGFGVILTTFVGINIIIAKTGPVFSIGHVGVYSVIIVALYLLAMRTIFIYEGNHQDAAEAEKPTRYPGVTLKHAIFGYAVASLVIIVAATWLPFVGTALADAMGWHKSFVGTIFIAAATSLPEAVVTISALRLGAIDMAISNVLGSNLINILILAIEDVFYKKGPILSYVSPVHAISALSAALMSGIVIVGFLYRPEPRLMRAVGWISIALFMVYVANLYVLYFNGE
jgi:cation:H+ antiporter